MIDYRKSIAYYYRDKFEKYGATPKGVDWNGGESQNKRFKVQYEMVKSILSINSRVIDYGCGYGAMATFLQKNSFYGEYTGYDVVEDYIQYASKANSLFPNYRFVSKILNHEKFDILFSSGVFHVITNKQGSWISDYVKPTIEHMLSISDICVMNFLKPNPTHFNEGLFFPEINSILGLVTNNQLIFDIAEDYGLWEWTIMMRRNMS
jgi:SAM-dependent methyltransferase